MRLSSKSAPNVRAAEGVEGVHDAPIEHHGGRAGMPAYRIICGIKWRQADFRRVPEYHSENPQRCLEHTTWGGWEATRVLRRGTLQCYGKTARAAVSKLLATEKSISKELAGAR